MTDKEKTQKKSEKSPRGKNETKRLFKHLRQLRKENPDVTIILPSEKIKIQKVADISTIVSPYVIAIKQELDSEYGKWKGDSSDSHIKQVKKMLKIHFDFSDVSEKKVDETIDGILYVRDVRLVVP